MAKSWSRSGLLAVWKSAVPSPARDGTRSADGTREASLIELVSLSDWHRFVPESLGILAVIALVQAALPEMAADRAAPHPFWIAVLLMSGQYGIMGGLFAALAATGALFLEGPMPQSATQDFYAYAGVVAVQPCAWLAIVLLLGGLRTLHIHQQTDTQARLNDTEQLAADLAEGLKGAVGEIERLEQRIAEDSSTLASFLHSLAKVQFTDRRALVASFADVVRYGAGATSFAIYIDGKNGFEPYLGVEDGARVGSTAVAPLAPSLLEAVCGEASDIETAGAENIPDAVPCWAPIQTPGSATPAGVIVCSRLEPSRDPAIAARRLDEISRVMAALLPWCPEISSGARRNVNA